MFYSWLSTVITIVNKDPLKIPESGSWSGLFPGPRRRDFPGKKIIKMSLCVQYAATTKCMYMSSVSRLTGMHLWRGEYGPFIRYAQMDFCRRLIVVPLTTFHRLAEEIGDPQGELIFLFNTTRCGSTLLTQVSQRIDVMLC